MSDAELSVSPSNSHSNSDANLMLKNPKYRSYADELSNVLQRFDKSRDWSDLVKQIQKVQKVLAKYSNFEVLPVKLTFCKRMAHCLNPELPAGVHLKVLQTFQTVFKRIGPERFATDIALYSMGIFPLFQYSAINVKPVMLSIFEEFYLPLKKELIPSLSGLLMAVLPGLEEEGSEFYDRILKFIEKVRDATDPTLFYRALWKAMILSPTVRLPTINYLNNALPREMTPTDVEVYLPETQDLVRRALIEGLSDSNILTQRTTMETMINHFPISSMIFNDWESIAVPIVKLVLRKEVALNRRLHTWFLSSDAKSTYFETFGKPVLVAAIQQLFSIPPETKEIATLPFKVMMSLLEIREIGEAIIENVLVSIFYSLHRFKEGYNNSRELRTGANSLLEMVEPAIIWEGVIRLFTESDSKETIGIIDSLVDTLNCDEETRNLHLPNLLTYLLTGIESIAKKEDAEQLLGCLQLARKVFGKFSVISAKSEDNPEMNEETQNKLRGLYKALLSYQTVLSKLCSDYIFPHFDALTESFPSASDKSDTQTQRRKVAVSAIELLVSIFVYLPFIESENSPQANCIPEWLEALRSCANLADPEISCAALSAIVQLLLEPNSGIRPELQKSLKHTKYISECIVRSWSLLQTRYSVLHFKVSEIMLRLLVHVKDLTVETISNFLIEQDPQDKVDACRRFAILWKLISDRTQKNPLANAVFLMLDTLSDKQPMICLAGRSWLAECIPKSERVLEPLLRVLLDPNIVRIDHSYVAPFDTRRVVYVLNLLKDIISCDFVFISCSNEKAMNDDILVLNEQQENHARQSKYPDDARSPLSVTTYSDLIVSTTLRLIQGYISPQSEIGDYAFISGVGVVQSTSASLLRFYLQKVDRRFARNYAILIQHSILKALARAVELSDLVLQVELLRLLKIIVTLQNESTSSSVHTSNTQNTELSLTLYSTSLDSPAPVVNMKAVPIAQNMLFVSTVIAGLKQPLAGNVRYYWMEFISSVLPYCNADLKIISAPICLCLCEIIHNFENVYSFQLSQEVLIMLHTIQLILADCFVRSEMEILQQNAINSGTTGGVIGDVFGMFIKPFAGEEIQTTDLTVETRNALLKVFPNVLRSLIQIWEQPTRGEDELANKFIIQDRIVKILDPIFKNFPYELLYSFLSILEMYRYESQHAYDTPKIVIDMLNAMDCVTPSVIFRDCATIIGTLLKSKFHNTNAPTRSPNTEVNASHRPLHEITVMDFVNRFIVKTITPDTDLAKAVPELLSLIREGMNSNLPQLFISMVRMVNHYSMRVAGGTEDKRYRKDFAETTYRLVDLTLRIAANNNSVVVNSGANNRPDTVTLDRMRQHSLKAIHVLGDIIPKLYSVISDDKDRAVTSTLNAITLIMKDRSEANLPWADVCAQFLCNIIDNGYSLAIWKKSALEIFNDNNFFAMDFNGFNKWRKIIDYVMVHDKGAFPDLLKVVFKSLQSHASNIFTAKEVENQIRARNIKRMAFVILAGEMDQYSGFVQGIQEKLLEALKLGGANVVYEQVFLCMRVLLVRVTSKRLSTFWPAILTEMMRIFGFGGKITSDVSLILAACKLLDVALITPSEQFKLYEWMFIDDCLLHQSEEHRPKVQFIPFIELLGRRSTMENPIKLNINMSNERQPLILERSISSVEQLFSYLRHYSKAAYVNLVTGGEPTKKILEAVIAADMITFQSIKEFEGTPEQLITERAKRKNERQDKTLKIQTDFVSTPDGGEEVEDMNENAFDEFEISGLSIASDGILPPVEVQEEEEPLPIAESE